MVIVVLVSRYTQKPITFIQAESILTLTSLRRSTSPLHMGVVNSPQASTFVFKEVTTFTRIESAGGDGLGSTTSITDV